jgi:regulator of sigma E protease
VIGSVLKDSPAERAGVRPGDRVVSVDGREVATWEQFFIAVGTKANREVRMIVERDGRRETLRVTPTPQTKYEVGDVGVLPEKRPQIQDVTPGAPASVAGLKRGDVIVGIEGEPSPPHARVIERLRASADKPLTLTILRDGVRRDVQVTPRGKPGAALIGVRLSEIELRTADPTLLEAIQMSFERNWEWSKLIFRTLAGLFTRETSVRQLMGPVGIAELSGGAAELGWLPLFNLMSMISLNLGLLNLLPIPVLDGGHIFIMALEGLARRDFSVRVKEKLLLAGFVVLMMLMATVIYNDLMRVQWIERIVPWR